MSSQNIESMDQSEIPKNNEISNSENLLKCGLETILQSFESKCKDYLNEIKELKTIIKDLKNSLDIKKEENYFLKKENQFYKNQMEQLKNENNDLKKIINGIKGKLTETEDNNYYIGIVQNKPNKNIKNNDVSECAKKDTSCDFSCLTERYNKNRNNHINNYNYLSLENKRETKIPGLLYKDKKKISNISSYKCKSYLIPKRDESKQRKRNNTIDKHSMYINHHNFIEDSLTEQNNKENNNKSLLYKNNKEDTIKKNLYKNMTGNFSKRNFMNFSQNFNTMKIERRTEKVFRYNDTDKKHCINNLGNNSKIDVGEKSNFHLNDGTEDLNNNIEGMENNEITDEYKNEKIKEMTDFLKKCRYYLDKEKYEIIVKTFQDYKDDLITDKGIIHKTHFQLKNNLELLNLFDSIISEK